VYHSLNYLFKLIFVSFSSFKFSFLCYQIEQAADAAFRELTLRDAQQSLHVELDKLIATATSKETPVSISYLLYTFFSG